MLSFVISFILSFPFYHRTYHTVVTQINFVVYKIHRGFPCGSAGKESWCWERLKAGGEEDDKGWDGWMASPKRWTWVWEVSGSWWWTGQPGVLQSMELQRVRHDSMYVWSMCCADLSSSVVSDAATPGTVAHHAPLFMGILQARVLKWVAMPSSRGSSQLRD